jgi:hypothetical protein
MSCYFLENLHTGKLEMDKNLEKSIIGDNRGNGKGVLPETPYPDMANLVTVISITISVDDKATTKRRLDIAKWDLVFNSINAFDCYSCFIF